MLEYHSNLVVLPRLDKWKLEVSGLLEPNKDIRYVDMELCSGVGQRL